ncbi:MULTISPECIES: Arc family DNA-binding protein [Delftia]|nr:MULTISPECIES: Arc family DNA-binding protein [Delftia]WON87355.1 Arc family DNA-binding protein [Delftia sp. UGAL515B_04]
MRDRISEAAKAGHRSMNAEIVARIRRSFELDEAGDADQAGVEQGAAGLREEISRLCQLLQEHKDAAAGLFEAHKEAVVDEALKRLRSETGMAAGRAPGKR